MPWYTINCPEHGCLADVRSLQAQAYCRECDRFYTVKGEKAKERKRPKAKRYST